MGWLRHPKTTQERREHSDPETAEYVRAKRAPMNLPNYYDDAPRGKQKSWKKQRRQRWKEIA